MMYIRWKIGILFKASGLTEVCVTAFFENFRMHWCTQYDIAAVKYEGE